MVTANYDLDLTGSWLFCEGDFARKANMVGDQYHASSKAGGALSHLEGFEEESAWRMVTVPHDWLTELPVDEKADPTAGCKARNMAWYQKKFRLPQQPIHSARLVFDGVLGQCCVFVNGVQAGRNESGYNRFSMEVGDYLLPGEENQIALFVDARRHEGWWYEGAGIYRGVHLEFREESHILREDCFVRTAGSTLLADVKVTGSGAVKAVLQDPDGVTVGETCTVCDGSAEISISVESPKLWTPETPALYKLCLSFAHDKTEFSVGFRDITWEAEKGMCLNGKPYRVKGVCCHQDHGGLGAAVCKDVEHYRILRLKSLGANAYRCAHHAPSESLLDLCDRLGMLVMVENRHFNVSQQTMEQLDALIKLSRSHPCVFLYCMFNEEPWQSQFRGKRIAAKLRQRVRQLDDTRPVTGAQNAGVLLRSNASEALDVVGINYNLDAYENCHALAPEKVMLGTENSPTFATRGVYETHREKQIFADEGTEYPKNFSQPLWQTMETVERHDFVAGCFVWSGFDHRGEPNPFGYPSVSSHWGYLDCCGFDKNIANWLRAYYLDQPFMAFAQFADAPTDGMRRVVVYTNAPEATLWADGVLIGTQQTENRMLVWQVPAEAQQLRVAYQDLQCCHTQPGKAENLLVENVSPSGQVQILNVCVTDCDGRPVLSENGLLTVEGMLLAVSNGDPNGHQDDRASKISMFHGMAQVIAPRGEKLILTYGGLAPVTVADEGEKI